MAVHKLECRGPTSIKTEHLEGLVWNEVERMAEHPGIIVAGIDRLNTQVDYGWEEETERAERNLDRVQSEEDRTIRFYVSGKIT